MIGIDVGGTTIKGVLVDSDGTVVSRRRSPTPAPDPTGSAVTAAVAAMVDGLHHEARSSHVGPGRGGGPTVGVVVPGIVDESLGLAIRSVNLGWRGIDLGSLLRRAIGETVALGHDVRGAALAEARLGGAVGLPGITAFVAIGTGVSAAFLADGEPLTLDPWAGEIGQLPTADGIRVEELASARAIARLAGRADAQIVADLVREGDARATQVWNTAVDVLAEALTTITTTLAPRHIVIAGGLSQAHEILREPLERSLHTRLGVLRRPRVITSTLGDEAAALGAAILGASGAPATR